MAGANDGQLHAFRTSDGAEVWSFIPPNLLNKLKDIAHKSHPTGLTHQYYVDGPISVADVWLGSGRRDGQEPLGLEDPAGLRRGPRRHETLWSSSSSCDGGFSNVYSATYPYYCGYHALDITNTASPAYKWRIAPSATQAPYLGDPWSKMMVSRVKIGGSEKWVGFIGGGHNLLELHRDGLRQAGKGVLRRRPGHRQRPVELYPGRQLQHGLCHARDPDHGRHRQRRVHRPGLHRRSGRQHLALQVLLDCRRRLLRHLELDRLAPLRAEAGIGPVYAAPSVARDANGNLWVYWGTGDKAEPIVVGGGTDRFFAVKDATLSGTLHDQQPRKHHLQHLHRQRQQDGAGTSTSPGPARSASPRPPSSRARSTSPPTPPPPAPATPAARPARQSSTPSPTSAAPGPCRGAAGA